MVDTGYFFPFFLDIVTSFLLESFSVLLSHSLFSVFFLFFFLLMSNCSLVSFVIAELERTGVVCNERE